MPLIRKTGAPAPKELGLFWPMQTTEGTTVEVYVYASALQAFDPDSVGPVGLLKRHRHLLERIAGEKYDPNSTGPLHITEDDLRRAAASGETAADEIG